MTDYELMIIINPALTEKEREDSFTKIKALIKEFAGKVESEEMMGEKKLAYKINRSEKGVYALYNLKLQGEAVKNISKEMNLYGEVWRYMFVKSEA